MISNENIKNIIADLQNKNVEVRVRDIAYVALRNMFEDMNVAYKSVFGPAEDSEIAAYDDSSMTEALSMYMKENFFDTGDADISFEENKAYMLKLKSDVEKAVEKGEIPKKEGYKILADISIKLNDKFNVSEDVKESVVIVNHKYNDVCPYCHREIESKPMSKEEAMKAYNLEEKK